MTDETRRKKALQRRYKKAVAVEMNIETIRESLSTMGDQCAEVQWFVDSEDGLETLLEAMDGDDSEAWEFKMAFSTLAADIYNMQERIEPRSLDYECSVPGVFDDFMVAIRACVNNQSKLMGYDDFEGDFFDLSWFEAGEAEKESKKRLERLTKADLIYAAQQCFNVAIQYIGIQTRYNDLKDAMDILRGKNASFLQQVREIEAAYEQATRGESWERDSRALDRMLAELPERCWIE